MAGCQIEVMALVLLSVALLISLCINLVFCIRRRAILCTDTDESCNLHVNGRERPSRDEGHYFHNLSHHELQEENPHNHHEQQENPIYGNISADRSGSGEVCYERMTTTHTRERRSVEPDLNYASLDLKVAKKHKKHHRQQGHAQGRNNLQDQLPVHLTPPVNSFLEVEADIDAQLPSRDTSTMVSHSSIYLNSHQIAQETEDMERERGLDMQRENAGWEGIRRQEEGGSGKWDAEEDSGERKDCSNGSVWTELSEVEANQSGTDQFHQQL